MRYLLALVILVAGCSGAATVTRHFESPDIWNDEEPPLMATYVPGGQSGAGWTEPSPNYNPAPIPQPPIDRPSISDVEIMEFSQRVVETDGIFWTWAWTLQVRNDADVPVRVHIQIRFIDADGIMLDDALSIFDIDKSTLRTYEDSTLIDSLLAPQVVVLKVEVTGVSTA